MNEHTRQTGYYCKRDDGCFMKHLRMGLRTSAVNVYLLSTRDAKGNYHGLAVNCATPLESESPLMIIAVNRTASAYPAIHESGLLCLNQISTNDIELLDSFGRSDMRDKRFDSSKWQEGFEGLPYLETAATNFFCGVVGAHDYDDHTVFVVSIEGVRLNNRLQAAETAPLIWINGGPARAFGRDYA